MNELSINDMALLFNLLDDMEEEYLNDKTTYLNKDGQRVVLLVMRQKFGLS